MTNSMWEDFSLSPPCKVLPFLSPRGPLFLLLAGSSRFCRCAVLSLSSSRSLPLLVLSLRSPSHPCHVFSGRGWKAPTFPPLRAPFFLVPATPSFPSLRALSLWPLRDLFFLVMARPFLSGHSEAFSLSSFPALFSLVIPRPFFSRHCEAFSFSSLRGTKCRSNLGLR